MVRVLLKPEAPSDPSNALLVVPTQPTTRGRSTWALGRGPGTRLQEPCTYRKTGTRTLLIVAIVVQSWIVFSMPAAEI